MVLPNNTLKKMKLPRLLLLVVLAAVHADLACALNNGLGLVPPMGFSSWNACSSNVTSAFMRDIVAKLISTGLAASGYEYINVDEGWLKGRAANGTIISDDSKFPEGMKGFGDWVHSQSYAPGKYFKYGLYSSRGTCQCSTPWYSGPGSQGHETQDAQYMANAGADYFKEDSCCGSQDPQTAFADYARMRDALNATGRPIYFSLCGWETWYAPVGYSLGNSWRISGDGQDWGALTVALNKMNYLTNYTGPGGWNDPDLLIGPNVLVGGQTDQQSRTQFSLWSLLPAPLIISSNLMEASDYAITTWNNSEAIAINQEPLVSPGFRLAGADMSYPCQGPSQIQVRPCMEGDPTQLWVRQPDGTISLLYDQDLVLDDFQCNSTNGSPVVLFSRDNGTGTCGGVNQKWVLHDDQTITNVHNGLCLDVYEFVGPQVDLWQCNGGQNQAWISRGNQLVSAQTGLCLKAVSACANVWGRPLQDGSWAMAMINNLPNPTMVTCDGACFSQTTLSNASAIVVRDLWTHENITAINPAESGFNLTASVDGDGGVRYLRLYPIFR